MTLLFLLPPSCIVAPIGNIANKLFFSHQNPNLPTMNYSQTLSLPTMLPYSMGMDIQSGPALNNFDEVRDRTLSSNRSISRDVPMSSTKSLVVYHERMTTNNDLVNVSPELFYETEQEKAFRVSKVANQQDTTRTTGDNNKAFTTYGTHEESVINIQLPYDSQAPTKPDLWSNSFYPISLHGLIEHFASDSKNIKDSLNFIAKFISNKQVNSGKANELNNFDSMGNAIWNFISSVYEAKWDSLFTDNKSTTLRSKISSKFTPRVAPNINKNNKEVTKPVPISIEKVPPPPHSWPNPRMKSTPF